MKIFKLVAVVSVMLVATANLCSAAKGGHGSKTIYVFGVATSFNDSTAYFTEIQQLDSVDMAGKTGMLANKQEYSYQLRDYMANQGIAHATCVTVNSENRKSLEKKYAAMRQRVAVKDKLIVKTIPSSDFGFERIIMAH